MSASPAAGFDSGNIPREVQDRIQDGIFRLIASVAAQIVLTPKDFNTFFDWLLGEAAASRALSYTASFIALGNVLGHEPKVKIAQWIAENDKLYVAKRGARWDEAESRITTGLSARGRLQSGQAPPKELLSERDRMKHTQVETVSLIRERLWDKARWKGVGFAVYEASDRAPVLVLIFSDIDAGKQIFQGWRSELTPQDADQRLRISIIRGIDKENPHSYRLLIASNPEAGFTRSEVRFGYFVCRMQAMEPTTSVNLDMFLKAYEQAKKFYFAPGFVESGASHPEYSLNECIRKRELTVREAWSIGFHDIDGAGIVADDDPIIPNNIKRAPVLDLLRAKRERA